MKNLDYTHHGPCAGHLSEITGYGNYKMAASAQEQGIQAAGVVSQWRVGRQFESSAAAVRTGTVFRTAVTRNAI